MSALRTALRELVGLFVEDGALAAMILAIVAVAAVIAALLPQAARAAGVVLLLGCLSVLIASIATGARR